MRHQHPICLHPFISLHQPSSTKPIPLPTPKRLRSLILPPPTHLLLHMTNRRRIASRCFPARIRPVIFIRLPRRTLDLRALIVSSRRLWRAKLGHAHLLLGYATAFVGGCALFAVGVDAAFGEVVGAAPGEDEDAPAVGYGCFLRREESAADFEGGWGVRRTVFIVCDGERKQARRRCDVKKGS